MPTALQTLTTVVVYDYLYDPTTGLALANAPVTVSLTAQGLTVAPASGGAGSVVLAPRSYSTTTDANGYWQVSLVPTNLLSQTGARYAVNDGYQAPYQINPVQAGIPAAGWQSSAVRTTGVPTLSPSGQTVGALTVTGLLTAQNGITVTLGGLTVQAGATSLQALTATSINAGLIPGQVVFPVGGSGLLSGDSNLFWDNANKRLGIGTNSPGQALSLAIASGSFRIGLAPNGLTQTIFISAEGAAGSTVVGSAIADLALRVNTNQAIHLDASAGNLGTFKVGSGNHLFAGGGFPTLGALQAGIASQSITGSDTLGRVTVTTTAAPTGAGGAVAIINWANFYANVAKIFLQNVGGQAEVINWYHYNPSTTTSSIVTGQARAASTSYSIDFWAGSN